jgi:hypothetical protein
MPHILNNMNEKGYIDSMNQLFSSMFANEIKYA